jgi:regulator of RNase E activity RraB
MRQELTQEEQQATIDVIDRFKTNDPDLVKRYEMEFVITRFDQRRTLDLEAFLKTSGIHFDKLKSDGSDVLVVINMTLDVKSITDIESSLTYFASQHGYRYDGWGAFE